MSGIAFLPPAHAAVLSSETQGDDRSGAAQAAPQSSGPLRVTIRNTQEKDEAIPLPPPTPPAETQPPEASTSSAAPGDNRPSAIVSLLLAPVHLVSDLSSSVVDQLPTRADIDDFFTFSKKPAEAAIPEAVPPVALADASPVPQEKSEMYHSPGPIIKKEVLRQNTLQPELAALAPAAGGSQPDGAPLIPLPTPVSQVDPLAPAKTPDDTPTNLSSEDIKPLLDKVPITVEDPQPLPAPPPSSAAAPPALPPVTAKTPAPEAVATPAQPASSEPAPDLSRASKKIAKKVPSNLGKKSKKSSAPVAIDHAKEAPDTLKQDETASVKHEAMGIKIEVSRPGYNVNYELQRAYDTMNAGNSTEAIRLYKNVLDNDPKNTNALFALATLYHRAGQIDLARPLYGKLLSLDPNNRDGINNFMVLMADEAPEAALQQLEQLEARNPKFSPIPAQMAVIYQKLGNQDKASEKMFHAIELAPENLIYRYNLAIILDKQQKYEEAANLYRQIIEAYQRGESIPGNIEKIQQRLTFIGSNRH